MECLPSDLRSDGAQFFSRRDDRESVDAEGGYRWIKGEANSWFYGAVARLNLEYKW